MEKLSVIGIVVEVTIFFTVALLTLLQAYNKFGIQPFMRGFFCDDQTIAYPYNDDTISDFLAVVIFIAIPIVVKITIEAIHVFTAAKPDKDTCKIYVYSIYTTIGAFVYGALITMMIMEMMKMFAGRLRPHFLNVCDPNYSTVNCSHGYVQISTSDCRGTDEHRIIDARKSFPSGHATISAYGSIYTILYLYCRCTWNWQRYVRVFVPTIQALIVCLGSFVCISRVNDNKHHFSDVIAGALIGAAGALLTVKYVSCLKKPRESETFNNGIDTEPTKTQSMSTIVEMKG